MVASTATSTTTKTLLKIAGLVIATSLPALVSGQSSCPIQITSVDPHAVSAMGGAALRVDYRNTSPSPIGAIAFAVRFGQHGRPITLTEHQALDVNRTNFAQWNETAWLSPAAVSAITADQITVWPQTVAFGDGTVWNGGAQCAYRSNEVETVPIGPGGKDSIPVAGAVKASSEPASEDPQNSSSTGLPRTAEEKRALISAGKASLCTIRSYPAGAKVDVDGRMMGVTPLTVVLLQRESPRDIYVFQTGYKLVHRTVQPNGSTLFISAVLEPLSPTGSD